MHLGKITPITVALATISLLFIATAAAGDLVPGEAPADSNTEISARARVIDSLPVTISSPGHYYLRDSLTASALVTTGITITTSSVTIDLNGNRLSAGTFANTGIYASGEWGITIRNGVVSGWDDYGIRLNDCSSCTLEDLRLYSNGTTANAGDLTALLVGDSSIIRRCVVNSNRSEGIRVGNGCVITECTSSDNDDTGILTGESCVISRCVVDGNAPDDLEFGGGINAGGASVIESCIVTDNKGTGAFSGNGLIIGSYGIVRDCTVTNSDAIGIATTVGNRVEGCTSSNNGSGGIMGGFLGFTTHCQFIDNVCIGNGTRGVQATGQCLVQGNLCVSNDIGIYTDSGDNLTVGNVCFDNTTADYDSGDGTAQQFDPGIDFSNGDVPLPWANFEN